MTRSTAKFLAAALALGVSTAGIARAAEPSPEELRQQIQQLQTKVDQLEAKQQQQAAAPPTDATAATIDKVMSDADRRSQLFDADGSVVGGWNSDKQQFYLASSDGNFYLHPGLIFQFRAVSNWRDNAKPDGDSDFEQGFEVRRAKFYFDGNMFTKDLTYKFQWQDGNNGGAPSLEYGYGQYVYYHGLNLLGKSDLAVKAGQFKDVVFKEEFTGDQLQLMVERSLVNTTLGGIQTGPLIQGVDFLLTGNDTPLHADLLIHDGAGSGNTDFTNGRDVVGAVPTNFGVAVRADYKVFGQWIDTTDLTGKQSGKADLLDIGAGFDFTDASNSSAFRATADCQYEIARKWMLFGALYADSIDFRNTAGPGSRSDFGLMAEAGYTLNPAWQVTGRYSLTDFDNAFAVAGENKFHELAAGVNFFGPNGAWGNHAKLSFDLTYLPNGAPGGTTGLDYLASPGSNQVVARAQFQLWL